MSCNSKKKEKQGKKIKKLRTRSAKIQHHDFVAVFRGHFLCKIGDFLRFWPILGPPIEVTAKNSSDFAEQFPLGS